MDNLRDMANISSTDLFHFVGKETYLKSILAEQSFWPFYCIEYCWNQRHWAIPMLCFCDIPLSQIKIHIGKYGGDGYGIGMKKSWAIENRITPVVYASWKSDIYKKLKEVSKTLIPSTAEKDLSMEERLLYRVKRITASGYEQYLNNNNNKSKNAKNKKVKFYNEREWRYVPEVTEDIHMVPWDPLKNPIKKDFTNRLSENTKEKRLKFSTNDVVFIIIPNEEGRRSMIDFLRSRSNLPESEIDILISKILTKEEICNNF